MSSLQGMMGAIPVKVFSCLVGSLAVDYSQSLNHCCSLCMNPGPAKVTGYVPGNEIAIQSLQKAWELMPPDLPRELKTAHQADMSFGLVNAIPLDDLLGAFTQVSANQEEPLCINLVVADQAPRCFRKLFAFPVGAQLPQASASHGYTLGSNSANLRRHRLYKLTNEPTLRGTLYSNDLDVSDTLLSIEIKLLSPEEGIHLVGTKVTVGLFWVCGPIVAFQIFEEVHGCFGVLD